MNQQILTKSIVQEILNKVFTKEDLETLKLTWADGTELSFERQFLDRYEGKYLKYDLDKTKNLALSIYHDRVKQDLKKCELTRFNLEKLKKSPEDFIFKQLDFENWSEYVSNFRERVLDSFKSLFKE